MHLLRRIGDRGDSTILPGQAYRKAGCCHHEGNRRCRQGARPPRAHGFPVHGKAAYCSETFDGCDISVLAKLQQKAPPKTAKMNEVTAPRILVYIYLIGPISRNTIGKFHFVNKFTDHYTRWYEIYLMKERTYTASTLMQYNKAVVVQSGYRMKRLRCHKGDEYTAHEYSETYLNLNISQELAVATTPQQIGVSERDGWNMRAIVKIFLKDGGFGDPMWDEMFFTIVSLSNRVPQSALDDKTPYTIIHGKGVNLSILRAIGARAFARTSDIKRSSVTGPVRTSTTATRRTARYIASTTPPSTSWLRAGM